MKFLKSSIIILFILSFFSAGLSLYLSNIRENEKEKRIYLEGVKTDLEERLAKVESDKAKLSDEVTQLQSENKNLGDKLKQEQDARQEVLALISQKDADLETIRSEATQAQFAFKDAQKRNQELERILDELEARMRQIEGQSDLPGSEVGYLEIKPIAPTEPNQTTASSQTVTEEKKDEAVTPEITFKPLTNLPEPPKKRRLFPFFNSSDSNDSKAEVEKKEVTSKEVSPVSVPAPEPSPVQTLPPLLPKVNAPEPVVQKEPVQKGAIAAGSVLLVNRKYNFVVINLGSRQSLDLNDIVTIQQGGDEIAKARVEKVYDDYSAAYIIEEQSDHPIAEGDAVARV